MPSPESGNSTQLLKYGSEQIRDYVDPDTGDVYPLANLPNSDIDEAFTAFEWADGPVPVSQEPVVAEEPFSTPADHKSATRKAAMRQQFADGPMIETESGLPHYYDRYAALPLEQQERTHRFTVNLPKLRDAFTRLRQIEADIAAADETGKQDEISDLDEQRLAVKQELRDLGANPDLP